MRISLFLCFLFLSCSQLEKFKGHFNKQPQEERFFNLAWNKNLDPKYRLGNLPIGWVTPTIHEQKIYVGDLSGNLNVYDKVSGRRLNFSKEEGAIQGKPLIFEKMLIYGTSEGKIIARDKDSLELIYDKKLGSSIESEVYPYKGRLFVHLRNHAIAALDIKTGKILWSYKRAVPFLTTLNRVSVPLGYQNSILVGFADGYLASLSIHDGHIIWEKKLSLAKKFLDIDLSPVIVNGTLWVGSLGSDFFIINPKNGVTLRRLVHKVAVPPVKFDGKMILLTDAGEILKLDNLGAVESRSKLTKAGFSSAVTWRGHIVASTFDGSLVAISKDLTKIIDTHYFGHSYSSLFGFIEADEKYLAAYSSRNRLYVFR